MRRLTCAVILVRVVHSQERHTLMSLYKCRFERSDEESLPNPASEEGRGRGVGEGAGAGGGGKHV